MIRFLSILTVCIFFSFPLYALDLSIFIPAEIDIGETVCVTASQATALGEDIALVFSYKKLNETTWKLEVKGDKGDFPKVFRADRPEAYSLTFSVNNQGRIQSVEGRHEQPPLMFVLMEGGFYALLNLNLYSATSRGALGWQPESSVDFLQISQEDELAFLMYVPERRNPWIFQPYFDRVSGLWRRIRSQLPRRERASA